MTRYRDEEPDVDEVRVWSEDAWSGMCALCGHSDHRQADCRNVPRDSGIRRKTRAEQIAATRRKKS